MDDVEEAAGLARVAGHTLLIHSIEKRVSIAVISNFNDLLNIARTLALYPEFISTSTPICCLARLDAPLKSTPIDISKHQNFFTLVILNHDRQ
jgi:hypothetical protein